MCATNVLKNVSKRTKQIKKRRSTLILRQKAILRQKLQLPPKKHPLKKKKKNQWQTPKVLKRPSNRSMKKRLKKGDLKRRLFKPNRDVSKNSRPNLISMASWGKWVALSLISSLKTNLDELNISNGSYLSTLGHLTIPKLTQNRYFCRSVRQL